MKAKFFLIRNMPADLHNELSLASARLGLSMRSFILEAIREKIARLVGV